MWRPIDSKLFSRAAQSSPASAGRVAGTPSPRASAAGPARRDHRGGRVSWHDQFHLIGPSLALFVGSGVVLAVDLVRPGRAPVWALTLLAAGALVVRLAVVLTDWRRTQPRSLGNRSRSFCPCMSWWRQARFRRPPCRTRGLWPWLLSLLGPADSKRALGFSYVVHSRCIISPRGMGERYPIKLI